MARVLVADFLLFDFTLVGVVNFVLFLYVAVCVVHNNHIRPCILQVTRIRWHVTMETES